MGRIEKDVVDAKTDAVEEPEIVTKMKEVEKKYLELENEYEKKLQALAMEYTARQQPLLLERKKVLCTDEASDGLTKGTPACPGFWFKAFSNHPVVNELIQEWDEPVLNYLENVEYSYIDPTDSNAGFNLKLFFRENPYFTQTVLEKKLQSKVANPFCGQTDPESSKCSKIEWHPGKDVTVEMVAKKVKGGGAKKAKQKKEKETPRPSFFRDFFRDLHREMELSDDARDMAQAMGDESDEEDGDELGDEGVVARLLDIDHEVSSAIKEDIVPRAVRWYTGEAAPDDDDDDEEEEEEDEDDEDESEEEESSARPPRRGAAAKRKGKPSPQSSPETKPKEEPKPECKQQ